jgi:hypothetical protein
MKKLLLIATLAASGLCAPALGWAQASASASERVGTFKSAQGAVRLLQAGKDLAPVPGQALTVSDSVITGPDGAAAITLRDGTTLNLGPKSRMDMSAFEFNSTTQQGSAAIHLLQGSMRVVTGLLGKVNPDRFKVTTPTSVVGVRGTDFIVEAHTPEARKKRRGTRSPRATMV